ncbi:sigma factor-like helix-turn-helix DNA-binding protein [Paenibacillus polymyxa]|uniref:sigma factor-like helix-turn-helix DNA-binding protein n=1 Tax=Paenibacillus polymyxa TaxID=1406 RepID=UPI0009BA782A|nr:sigma factor-like helix-turn-helix DNA-binding protein [Paenibacillus polymyxa]
MGHVKIDIAKSDRGYAVKYSLNDAAGVRSLLRDRHRISSARFRGDTAASDILIDLHSAINSAGLTERQTEAIAWVYGADLTQAKAAELMGITQPTVAEAIETAVEKLAAVYQRWEYGEISVEYDAQEVIAQLNPEETAEFLRLHKGIEFDLMEECA